MKQKKLIKLNLETEQLVSLNDHEMFNLKGGEGATSSNDCIYESIKLSITLTEKIYEYGENNSAWNCPKSATLGSRRIWGVQNSHYYSNPLNII